MAIIKSGDTADGYWQVDTTAKAGKASVRSQEIGTGGYYRATLNSGTIAAPAAGSILYAFQNPSTSPDLAIIMALAPGLRAVVGNATPSCFVLSAYITRSYTVLDTTGAAAAVSFKGQMITQSSQQNALYRIANTGAMSGGTGTDDAQPFSSMVFTHPGTISTLGAQTFSTVHMSGMSMPQYPIVLAPGEGIRVRTDQAWPANNTAVLFMDVAWLETITY
jgi:hypothetical protein